MLQEDRTWNASKGGKKLDFEAVLALLRNKAQALESKDRQLYLRVIGIDATAPENLRVVTKKVAKPTKASVSPKASKAPPTPPKRAVAASTRARGPRQA